MDVIELNWYILQQALNTRYSSNRHEGENYDDKTKANIENECEHINSHSMRAANIALAEHYLNTGKCIGTTLIVRGAGYEY